MMILNTHKIESICRRHSKLGLIHEYKTTKTILVLRCDSCGNIFQRGLSEMSPLRRSNSYFHVCNKCDVKRFAQRKGAEARFIWNKLASITADISKL